MKQTFRLTETLRVRRRDEQPELAPVAAQTAGGDAAQQPLGTEDPSLKSDALLQGRRHVSIAHNGETYHLRATRLGKLILTK